MHPPLKKKRGSLHHVAELLERITPADSTAYLELVKVCTHWDTVIPERMRPHVRPAHVKDSILYVQAPHSTWVYQLQWSKEEILSGLIQKDPSLTIKDIKVTHLP